MKYILITGEHGYIGTALKAWLKQWPQQYVVHMLGVRTADWKAHDFSVYHTVIHAAAIVHKKEAKTRGEYESVNCGLSVQVYKQCQAAGVKQFIFISTAGVYAERDRIGRRIVIGPESPIGPYTEYGRSKWMAECALNERYAKQNTTKLAIVRPPLVYGAGCPGNYGKLSAFARFTPFIPDIDNQRSMIHIDNLSAFFQYLIDREKEGVFLPQNAEFVSVTDMMMQIGRAHGKRIYRIRCFNPLIKCLGRWIHAINLIYGSNVYDRDSSEPDQYCVIGFEESILKTECAEKRRRKKQWIFW